MQNIEEQAIKNYQKNIEFFKEYNEKVSNKILALESLLNNGKLSAKYDLVYENGYFDVVELSSGAKLYNTNSQDFSQKIVDNINLKKNDQSFRSLRKINFEKASFETIKNANAYTNFATTAEIYELYHKNINDSSHMKELDKFIFLGVGLGLHIPKAIKKYDFQVVLIVEDNLELFRLSLFTIDYKQALMDTTSFFSIADNAGSFRECFNGFYTNAFFKNQFIKFHLFSSAYEAKIREIQAILISRPEATYSHNRLLEKNRKVLDRINAEYKFLDLRKRESDTIFQEKAWLVLGAGPSLYKNAQWVKDNQDRFIIVAAFTALNTLKRVGVTPDIAVQIDENVYTTHEMLKNLGDLSFLDDTLLFFSASVSGELFEHFKKENIYLHEDRTKYKLSRSTLTVSSVGDSIHAFALIFNAPEIYLLGIDLALSDDGLSHTPDHFKARSIENKKIQTKENQDFHLGDAILQITGNFKEKVNSTPLFMLSIPVINYFTRKYKAPMQTIYNLSDGCKLDQTIPTPLKDVTLPQKQNKILLRKEMKKYFDTLSTTELDQNEIDGIYCRIGQIKDYLALLETFKNAPHSDSLMFKLNLIEMVSAMCNHECIFELRDLMTIYYMNTTPYADDFFNTKELKNPKKFTKKFHAIFVKNVKKIIETYEKDLHVLKVLEKENSQA
ncbi:MULTISPECIES: 6-hydroxymethylpterin diphosphokinase MptE-like protein [Sulfurimonas]|uniref:6-hydroxymethylpterin diphosphokinase MptE-like protein n=1 Tax=Sulfurimonas TaxID=202746 RepID=UPI00165FA17B|nr:6-hydroxymethylpterin diphosphokinase MptE-like protein [Sulfurimonas hydrogeniphila]